MLKLARVIIIAALISSTLLGCGKTTKTIDGKAAIPVAILDNGKIVYGTCYLLEIDVDKYGEELDEQYLCVDKDVWDRHDIGDTYTPPK